MGNDFKKENRLWKISIISIVLLIFIYLLYNVITDQRWLFSEHSTNIVIALLIIVGVLYILKIKKKKR